MIKTQKKIAMETWAELVKLFPIGCAEYKKQKKDIRGGKNKQAETEIR